MKFRNLYTVNKYQQDIYTADTKKRKLKPDIRFSALRFDSSSENPEQLNYSWLGHSSVYLCTDHTRILIDPVFSSRISFTPLLGPRRFDQPSIHALSFGKLDAILITHDHYDHLDRPTIRMLDPVTERYIVPEGVGSILVRFGVRREKITELQWYRKASVKNLEITCTPSHHNSTRYLIDQDRTLWCSYVIESRTHRIFHSGDTAFSPVFEDIHSRWNTFDLVFMECGQYGSPWHHMHMFPEESVSAAEILNSRLTIPIHHSTYCLALHDYREPVIRFENAAQKLNLYYELPGMYQLCTMQ